MFCVSENGLNEKGLRVEHFWEKKEIFSCFRIIYNPELDHLCSAGQELKETFLYSKKTSYFSGFFFSKCKICRLEMLEKV